MAENNAASKTHPIAKALSGVSAKAIIVELSAERAAQCSPALLDGSMIANAHTRAELDTANEALDRHAVDVASHRRALLDVIAKRQATLSELRQLESEISAALRNDETALTAAQTRGATLQSMMLAVRDKLATMQSGAATNATSKSSASTSSVNPFAPTSTTPMSSSSSSSAVHAFTVPNAAAGADFADDDNDDDYDPNAFYATAAALLPQTPVVAVNPVSLLPPDAQKLLREIQLESLGGMGVTDLPTAKRMKF